MPWASWARLVRVKHKKQYHPMLTSWLQADGVTGAGWGKHINLFKAYAGLPQKPVDEYTTAELQKLNQCEVKYDLLRRLSKSHKQSLALMR